MTLDETARYAEELAKKYNPRHVVPFPYENVLLDHPGLDIAFTDLEDDDVSGASLYKDKQFILLINTQKPETRQHFTLGHELGHYFLHADVLKKEQGIVDGDDWLDGPNILYRQNGTENRQLELEANNFAGSLLMPADLVRRAWEVTHDIEECATLFQVSSVAMSVRLTRLGLVN